MVRRNQGAFFLTPTLMTGQTKPRFQNCPFVSTEMGLGELVII